MLVLALLALATNPRDDVARECVDSAYLNHFYDEHGRLVFDQLIFRDWSEADARFNVRAWRLIRNPYQLPVKDWSTGRYVSFWKDGEQLRRVEAKSFIEDWTQWDVELADREFFAKERRRGLLTPKRMR